MGEDHGEDGCTPRATVPGTQTRVFSFTGLESSRKGFNRISESIMRGLVCRGLHASGRMTLLSSRAQARSNSLCHASKAANNDIGFGFSAGGLLFPYYVGLVSGLMDQGVMVDSTKVAGASAGSLIAALSKSGVSEDVLVEATLELAANLRTKGTATRLRSVLKQTLQDALPSDIAERCNGLCFVAVTRVQPGRTPFLKSDLISQFKSRDHLIEALLTSCHVPYWLDGNAVTTFEEGMAMDGGLTAFIPVPPVKNPIRVACFPRKSLGSLFGPISISPDAFEDFDAFPYTMSELISLALNPGSDNQLQGLLAKGRRDALAFVQELKV